MWKSFFEHLNDFQDIVNKLTTMKIVLDDELQALFLLSSLLDSWETLVVTISNSAPEGVISLDVIKESMFNIRRKEMDLRIHKLLLLRIEEEARVGVQKVVIPQKTCPDTVMGENVIT